MKKLTAVFLIIFAISIYAQNYKQVQIYYTNAGDLNLLLSIGMEFDHAEIQKDNSVVTFISDRDFELLKGSGFTYRVLIDDWYDYYSNLPKMTEEEKSEALRESKTNFGVEGFNYGSMGGYYTYQEIMDELDEMYTDFPNLITEKFSIGTTVQGREIWAAKISDNPNVSENEPQILFDALIHAREGASNSTLMYYMFYLLENYGSDDEVTYLVNNREIYFVPCFNPDGYEYNRQTNPNGGGMWRKNRSLNGGSYGVDLNRNFGYQWGYDNTGSSPTPSSETYRGPFAFSELETQAVRNLVISNEIKTYINYHTYGNVVMHPWGYINEETPDSLIYRDYAAQMSSWNGYIYGTGMQTIGYNSNGNARDWMYGEQVQKNKVFGYVFEVGSSSDGFWAPQSRILPIAQENLKPNLFNTWVAGEYVNLKGAIYSLDYFNPGDNADMFAVMFNRGLSDAFNITVELVSSDPYVTVNTGAVALGNVASRETDTLATPFNFTVSASAPIGEQLEMIVKTYTGSYLMAEDTVRIITGTPTFLFEDGSDDPTVFWNITSTPLNPKWEATTSAFYSSPVSYTDSKNGTYANNATVTMTLADPIDLTASNSPRLTFWTKYEIESNWDCGQVKITTNNGATWIPLSGNYTVAGSGSGVQPSGQPLYEGNQPSWIFEEVDLSPYEGESVKLQFVLRSDGWIQEDGWYLDDIAVYYYGEVPVELLSFGADVKESSVVLTWSTATETNNRGFEIEKSTDKSIWSLAGFIDGAGTSTEINYYKWEDASPAGGISYYRMRQIDFDGTSRVYEPVEVSFAGSIDFKLEQNYPNPFNPTTIIKFSIPTVEKGQAPSLRTRLAVFDILGRQVALLINEFRAAGTYEIEFDAGDLPSGIYFYRLSFGEFIQSRKMILIK